MTRVLVTGGAGYVGSHACKALAQHGMQPIVVDDLSHGHRRAVQWGPLYEANILDRDRLVAIMRETKPDALMHFAGKILVGESVEKPDLYFEHNVTGFQRTLDAARECGISKIVFSSSCAVYGVPQYTPLNEAHPCLPVQPYGATKRIAEQMLEAYVRAYGMTGVALRYFNAAGADPDGDIGECHEPETHLIPNVLRAAAKPGMPLSLNGVDYDTPDGTCVRDYVHVSDLAEAHVAALGLAQGFEAINLCAEVGISNLQLIRAAEAVVGRKIEIRTAPRREGDVPVLVGTSSKAKTLLGWAPKQSNLETILQTAWKWMENNVA